jgi:hypothetical protein
MSLISVLCPLYTLLKNSQLAYNFGMEQESLQEINPDLAFYQKTETTPEIPTKGQGIILTMEEIAKSEEKTETEEKWKSFTKNFNPGSKIFEEFNEEKVEKVENESPSFNEFSRQGFVASEIAPKPEPAVLAPTPEEKFGNPEDLKHVVIDGEKLDMVLQEVFEK